MREYRRYKGDLRDGVPYDTHGKPIESCIKAVPDGGRFVGFHTCGKRLKGDPEFPHLCGVHTSAIHRRRSKEQVGRDKRARRDAELEKANRELMALNERLGIQSTLQTKMPTTGPDAFIPHTTGHAIVRIDHLENLADEIEALRSELERWQRIDANGELG